MKTSMTTHTDDKQHGADDSRRHALRTPRQQHLATEALAIFDEITTSKTSWSDPDAIDRLARDIVLHALGLEDRDVARRVLLLALAAAGPEDIETAVALLKADRAAMLESIAERRAP